MRKLVFILIAAMVPPAFVAMGFIGYDYYERERARLIRDSLSTTRALAAAVDGEFAVVQAALLTLANSTRLTQRDFGAFHAQALDVVNELAARNRSSLINIILADENGKQLANTFTPYGAPLPGFGDPGRLGRTVASDELVISDLFVGPVIKRPGIGVAVPVRRDGRVLYRLTGGVSTERLSALLRQEHLPGDWIAVVLDTSGTIVARTHEEARFIGQKASPELARRVRETREDALASRTLEGIPVLTVFSQAPVSGYTVAIGIPQRELMLGLVHSVARLFFASFTALVVALALAFSLGRRYLRPGV